MTEPQLVIMPSQALDCYDVQGIERVFSNDLIKVRNSKITQVEGSHFDLVLPSKQSHQLCQD